MTKSARSRALPSRVPKNKLVKPGQPDSALPRPNENVPLLDYPLVFLKWALPVFLWEAAGDYLPMSISEELMKLTALLTWAHLLVWVEPYQAWTADYVKANWTKLKGSAMVLATRLIDGEKFIWVYWDQMKNNAREQWKKVVPKGKSLDLAAIMALVQTFKEWAMCQFSHLQQYLTESFPLAQCIEYLKDFRADPKATFEMAYGYTGASLEAGWSHVQKSSKIAYGAFTEKGMQKAAWNDALAWSAVLFASVSGYLQTAKISMTQLIRPVAPVF